MEFIPHSKKQEDAIFSEKRITLVATGIQWGKTQTGALRMKLRMHEYLGEDDNFIVCSPTYKIMQQSSLPAFLRLMKGYGVYNKQEAVFQMYNGGKCWFRTATDPDSIVGLTNVRHIWGDEAGLFPLYFWENIQARAAIKQCQIDLTTSPYTLNWIFKDLIRPSSQSPRPDLLYIKANSSENPYFPLEEYKRRQETMDPRRFQMMFGGEFGQMEGLVYDSFSEKENICPWPNLIPGVRTFAGIDWGYTEPFALVVHRIYPDGTRFQVSEVKKAHLTLSDMLEVARQKQQVWQIEHFFADPSQPGYIEEFNRAKLRTSAANNDIKRGVSLVYELLKTRELKFVENTSPHTLDELETYHYPAPSETSADRNIKEVNPVGQNDHCLDALRYLIMSTIDINKNRVIHGSQPTALNNMERLQKLMQKPMDQRVVR